MLEKMKINPKMKRLGAMNYSLIQSAVKSTGNFDPKENFCLFEEQLKIEEFDTIYLFMKWVHENKQTFGHGNYEAKFQEFLSSNKK